MPLVLTTDAAMACSHGGQVRGTPAPRVKANGAPVLMGTPIFVIVGCPNPPPPANTGPCVTAFSIASGATRVRTMGLPVMTQAAGFAPGVPGGGVVTVVNPGQVRVTAL